MLDFDSPRNRSGAHRLWMSALLLVTLITSIAVFASPAVAQSFSNETAWDAGATFYYQANYTGSYAHFEVLLDTDNNAATGYTINGIGADYLLQDTSAYKSTANGSSWSWGGAIGTVTNTSGTGTIKLAVPLSVIGSPASAKVAFRGLSSTWTPTVDPRVITYTKSTGGTAFYVSPSGNDANPGTLTLPWRTSQKAGNSATAGSTVYFRAGTYSPFDINVSGSAAGGYITFTSYPGETAVIDGSGYTGSYDHGLIHLLDRSYIKIIGFEVRNGSSSSSSFAPCGIFVQLYSNSTGGSYIQILNNNVHNIVNTASSNGNAHGILVRGEAASRVLNNVTVSGNIVTACQTGWSESLTVAGNVQTFTVSNNIVHDNNNIGIDCTGGYSGIAGGAQSRDGIVSGNTVYNCSTLNNPYYNGYTSAGLYVDGGTNIVMERNTVHHCDYGIQLSSEVPGINTSYVTVRSNLVYQNASWGLGIGGYQASGVGGTDRCTIVNNTFYYNDTLNWWVGELHCGWRATNNVFKNNIIYAGPGNDVFLKNIGTDGANVGTFDYNEYYSAGGNANAKWQWINQTSWTTTFASWKSVSGQDANSTFADPLLVSLTTPNFDTTVSSPARNSGNNLGATVEGTLDFAGNARVTGAIDKGAYEH